MRRRDFFKGLGVAGILSVSPLSAIDFNSKRENLQENYFVNKNKNKRVVIVGGGISGLSVANNIRAIDKEVEIIILEKNKQFHSCPGSNILLSKTASEYTNEISAPQNWIFNYNQVKNQFTVINCEVLDGDTSNKIVKTTRGNISYDTLIVATGIEYNYEEQFPEWSSSKIEKAKHFAPAAMIQDGGDEWSLMSERWESLILKAQNNPEKNYQIVINPTPKTNANTGKNTLRRCPPAAGERASMLASRIKKECINNLKVVFLIELDGSLGSKGEAFEQSWNDLSYCSDIYNPKKDDIIQPIFNARIQNISFIKKRIVYKQDIFNDDLEIVGNELKTINYDELILMAEQKTPGVVGKIFNVKGEVELVDNGFEVKNLSNHYILGDSQTKHPLPASGSMAMNMASILAKRIVNKLKGKDIKEDYTTAKNVCFSLVGESPNEGIKVEHNIFASKGLFKGKGNVPKVNGVFRTEGIAMEQAGWIYAIGGLFGNSGMLNKNMIEK